MAGEKTEPATSKRRSDERKKGNIFKSRETLTIISMVGMFYAFKLWAPMLIDSLGDTFRYYIGLMEMQTQISISDNMDLFRKMALIVAVAVGPLLLVSGLIAVVVTLFQTKLLVSFKALKPKMNRMSPLSGIKRMFSIRGVVELVKSVIKITILGVVVYTILKAEIPFMSRMMDINTESVMVMIGQTVLDIVNRAAIIFAFVALFDHYYQKWEYEKSIRMSKQEIKEEYKNIEGDPKIKAKIRERQQQAARKRMMQAVPSADVVIRNPTHYAVAIKYDAKEDRAPIVIAKGMDSLALKIIQIAEENGVVITENKPLARGLYDGVELEQEIPETFYRAVAEVLAFVYSLKNKK